MGGRLVVEQQHCQAGVTGGGGDQVRGNLRWEKESHHGGCQEWRPVFLDLHAIDAVNVVLCKYLLSKDKPENEVAEEAADVSEDENTNQTELKT